MAAEGGGSGLSTTLKRELKALGLMMLYFAAWLVPLLAVKNLLLEEYAVPLTHLSAAMIGALVLSKVVMVLEHVSLGAWVARQPAWVDVVLRTLFYGVGVVVVLLLEKGFEGRHAYGGFWPSLAAVFERTDLNHVWVNTICIVGALLNFNIVTVVSRNLRGQSVLGLLAKPLPGEPKKG